MEIQKPHRSQFEQLFEKVKDPVFLCTNCLCEYCLNNAEQSWDKSRSGEMQEPCFNCDECREYTGESKHKTCERKDCEKFLLSEYGANRNRRTFKIMS